MVKVAVNIVTFNSGDVIGPCLDSLREQTFTDFRIHVLDNASADNSVAIVSAHTLSQQVDLIRSPSNTGFAKAHNDLIRAFPAEYVLILNPDTVLRPDFLKEIAGALDARPDAGSASGKLLRMDQRTIDSTGIVMFRNQRHLDRGADEPDLGQFDRPAEVFGPSGAAALYRLSTLNDVAFDGQFFDEDFFAYREDADLAWRCRLMGWTSIYVPSAVARHRRYVTPDRRSRLPAVINYHSVKNRFLLRINNMSTGLYLRDFWPVMLRDAAVVGYVFAWEWSSIPAVLYLIRHFPRLWRKRAAIQSRTRIRGSEVDRWFYNMDGKPVQSQRRASNG